MNGAGTHHVSGDNQSLVMKTVLCCTVLYCTVLYCTHHDGGDNQSLVMKTLHNLVGYFRVVTGEIGSIARVPSADLQIFL